MPDSLDPDVASLLAQMGFDPVSSVTLTPGWRPGRGTYAVELADGGAVKVRRGGRPMKMAGYQSLAARLADPALPAPVAVAGRLCVEAWVCGQPLSTLRLTARHVDAAADLVGRLHARDNVPGRPFRRVGRTTAVTAALDRRLCDLVAKGTLPASAAVRLAALARRHLPERAQRGIVHGDICAENLVLRPDGRIVSIDHESLRVDFVDIDLARAWCRWALPMWAWTRFDSRYATWGRPVPGPEVSRSWRIVAAVHRAQRWSRVQGADSAAVLGTIDLLLQNDV